MKDILHRAGYLMICFILVLTTCYGIPTWQALGENPLPEGVSTTTHLSKEAEEKFRRVNYERDRLNRLIEYGNAEDIEHWERQKAALEPYQSEMQLE